MYAAAQSHFFLDRIAIQCSVSGMVPPTVAKSSHLDECNQDDRTQMVFASRGIKKKERERDINPQNVSGYADHVCIAHISIYKEHS